MEDLWVTYGANSIRSNNGMHRARTGVLTRYASYTTSPYGDSDGDAYGMEESNGRNLLQVTCAAVVSPCLGIDIIRAL